VLPGYRPIPVAKLIAGFNGNKKLMAVVEKLNSEIYRNLRNLLSAIGLPVLSILP
jgi:hypothetical protein